MSMRFYNPQEIEHKWRRRWAESNVHKTEEKSEKPKFYCLDMFPYPSGDGLHVGHWRGYVLSDVWSRYKKLQGFNVLHPMGWDAFGLPAENDAIKKGIHPAMSTKKNINNFKRQLIEMGSMYDWDRELNTSDENYYKFTQWIFIQMYKKGLAYRKNMPINWCPSCKTGLANEEVVNGLCERCETEITKKPMEQWMLKITEYADRLLEDLDKLDWPEKVKKMQSNWIGRSEGAEILFPLAEPFTGNSPLGSISVSDSLLKDNSTKDDLPVGYSSKDCTLKINTLSNDYSTKECTRNDFSSNNCSEDYHSLNDCSTISTANSIKVFTTRPDTLFGVTYIVLAPEHPLAEIMSTENHKKEVDEYIKQAIRKSNIDRMIQDKEKSGVFTGSYAINPVNGESIPIWISDYVLMDYGTGAIMAVPAHDRRDYEFAKAFNLPVRQVIAQASDAGINVLNETYAASGILMNSGTFSGMESNAAKAAIINYLSEQGFAKAVTNYKLRDWVFSRQRYWGEPIPIIHCGKCGDVPVPEADLPVTLPHVEKYAPSGTGESPLANITEWVNTTCPCCKGPARRDTNTMPQWAGSSWYFLRYCDPHNMQKPWDKQKAAYWLPVDFYIGGNEHAVLHLLYARFYTKFLYDIGTIDFDEPFIRLFNIGMINKDGYKMSKSKPNCVSSDYIVNKYGADTLRLYEMFMGPPEQESDWNDAGIEGVFRFLSKVWNIALKSLEKNPEKSKNVTIQTHKLIKGVVERLESQKVNTAVSLFMTYINFLGKECTEGIDKDNLSKFIILLAPFVPHFAEEVWEFMGNKESIFTTGQWPTFDKNLIQDSDIVIPVQVNGKVRDTISIEIGSTEERVVSIAKASLLVQDYLSGRNVVKTVYVKDKAINFVVK